MAGRGTKIVLTGLAVVVVVAVAAGAVAWAKLPEIAAAVGSRITSRAVTVGALRVSPGRWIGVELRDASLANVPGGSRPAMATVGSATGEVALWPLLHGRVVARSVQVSGADLLFEHVDGQPNWRSGAGQPDKPGDGRDSFPTVLGATLEGAITFRTTSGTPLVTRLDGVALQAVSADAPARLVGPASYQGVPVALDLKLGSYDQLHDATTPFPTDITLASGKTVLHFVGTMTDPLNVNGATGRLDVTAPTPEVLEKVGGADASPAPPLKLSGALQHDEPRWDLEKLTGSIGDALIEDGTLRFVEGDTGSKKPDEIAADLRFGTVDLDRLLAAFKEGSDKGGNDSGFVPDAEPNPRVTAKLAAAALSYNGIRLTKPALSMAVAPKLVSLEQATAGMAGGQVRVEARVRATGDGKGVASSATVAATGVDVAALGRAFGTEQNKLAGRMDLHAEVEGAGTAMAALRSFRGAAVATMAGGSVSAQWVELASTDIAGLLQSSRSTVPLGCLLTVIELRNGTALLGPVRLRSAAGTIVSRGQVDLLRQTVDLVVASEARTTGALALDVPVRVSGKLDDPSVAPAGGAAGQRVLNATPGRDLPGPLREIAQRSPCAR